MDTLVLSIIIPYGTISPHGYCEVAYYWDDNVANGQHISAPVTITLQNNFVRLLNTGYWTTLQASSRNYLYINTTHTCFSGHFHYQTIFTS